MTVIRRFDEAAAVQAQSQQVREHLRQLAQEAAAAPPAVPVPAPTYTPERRPKSRGQSRSKRQTHPQQQYRRISQPPVEPQPQYSTNLPSELRDLLKYQAQIPYDIIANQIVYRPDKPYVPHRVDPPQQQQQQSIQQAQYQGQGGAYQDQGAAYQGQGAAYQDQGAAYQGQGAAYQAQASSYTQAHIPSAYNPGQQYQQGYSQQLGYNQQQPGVRPVTENQYWLFIVYVRWLLYFVSIQRSEVETQF